MPRCMTFARGLDWLNKEGRGMKKCSQCGKEMNPIDYMLGPVCLACCKANHAKVAGKVK